MPPKAREVSETRATSRGRKAAPAKKSFNSNPPEGQVISTTSSLSPSKKRAAGTSRTRAKANSTKTDPKSKNKALGDEDINYFVDNESDDAEAIEDEDYEKPTLRSGRASRAAAPTASPSRKASSKTPAVKKSSSRTRKAVASSKSPTKKTAPKKATKKSKKEEEEEDEEDIEPPAKGRRGASKAATKSPRTARSQSSSSKATTTPRKSPPKTPKGKSVCVDDATVSPSCEKPITRPSTNKDGSAKDDGCDIKPILAIVFYFITSIGTVLLNKYLLTGSLAQLTVFLTWVQLTFSVGVTYGMSAIETLCCPPKQSSSNPQPTTDFFTPLLQTLPASIVFCLMLILNNLCLSYVHVAFYQVARCWTILISVIMTYFLYGETKSFQQLICCLIIVIGYVAACEGELPWSQLWVEMQGLIATTTLYIQYYFTPTTLTPDQVAQITSTAASNTAATGSILLGLISGFLSCIFVAYNSILNRQLQTNTKLTRNQIVGALNLNAAIIIFTFMIFNGELKRAINTPALWQPEAILPLFIVSLFGHLLGLATQLQIQYTSALGHNVSGTAKASVQSLIAWRLNPRELSNLTIAGTAATIIGCGLYSIVPGPAAAPSQQQQQTVVGDKKRK